MKKKIVLLLTMGLFAALALCGCGGTTPTEAANSFLTSVKNQDVETLKTVYMDDDFELAGIISDDASSEDSSGGLVAEDEQLANLFVEKLLGFDYVLGNETVNGDTATVDVRFTTYSIGSAFTSFVSEFMSQGILLAFSDASDEQIENLMQSILTSKLTDLNEKNYTSEATLNLVKEDGEWKVEKIEPGSDLVNAMTGNLVSAFDSLDKAYSFDE